MSSCGYCGNEVVWIQKPAGGWFPPFDQPEEFQNLDYEVSWSNGDWIAEPVDKELTAKLTRHYCEEFQRIVSIRRERQLAQAEEPSPEPPPSISFIEVEKWREPQPEKFIRVALRLRQKCPVCGARPFEWCTYKNNPNEQPRQLHTMRRAGK